MKILCQLWFGCLVHNVICQNFLLLCLQGDFQHPSLLVSGDFYYLSSTFLTGIFSFSSVMAHPYSYKTPNHISGAIFILGKMYIRLDCLIMSGGWSVAIL